jgi:uroporphyrinogen-III synthase
VRLLVTRPLPDGERTADALRAGRHNVLTGPMLRMQTLPFEVPDRPYAGVVMTSANAVRAIAGHPQCAGLAKLPAFAVGAHTAEAARVAGFADVQCARGDRMALAALLRERLGATAQPLLYLAGEDRAGDGELAPSGVALVTTVVYRMVKEARFSEAATSALREGQVEGVLHFSRRSAHAYIDCARHAGLLDRALAPVQFCLSRQVAEPLAAAGAGRIRIASHPNEAAMLALVDS